MGELIVENVYRPKVGLVDGPEKIMSCVACGTNLIVVKIIQPEIKVNWTLLAKCPCGDSAEPLEISGRFIQNACDGMYIENIISKDDCLIYEVKRK